MSLWKWLLDTATLCRMQVVSGLWRDGALGPVLYSIVNVYLSVCGQVLIQISGRSCVYPIPVNVMIMTVLLRTCTHTVLLPLSAGCLRWQQWCVYVPRAPCWFPLWTQGSLASLLRSPRLTALSCQTNEHARKQGKRKEREEKERGGGYERSGMRGRSRDTRKDINRGMK